MLRCALIVALAAPPAAAGQGASPVAWGPLPGQGAPAGEGVKGQAPSDMSPETGSSGHVETDSPVAAGPEPAPAPVEPLGPTGPAPSLVPPPEPGEATLELSGAGQGGQVVVTSPRGKLLGAYAVGPGQTILLRGAPGEYVVRSPDAPHGLVVPVVERTHVQIGPSGLAVVRDEGPTPGPVVRIGRTAAARDGNWRRPVSPILSALVPGLGQMVNREYARGAGFLLGAVSLGAGALGLALTRDRSDAATAGAHGRTFAADVVGAAGLGLLTGGLHLLYMAQVMDAYAGAIGKRSPRPHSRHKVSLELRRMATVGMRAGDPAAQLYADWNVGVLGQVAPRLSVGLTDLGLKFGPGRAALQGGPRLQYRVLERGRVWLSLAAGAIVQGAFASGSPPVVPEGDKQPRTAVVAAVPYGQLDLRLFILDRWSIDIVPRISAPLGAARYYRGDGAIPKQAVTLELGTGVGVYF
ncbi:hypothetical protein [Nannocystis bainbridge]|uniref:PEGA domain-containing protein n=1 Tax=Nannocystis bainbridge TaxID=2995303 RepID=A0ABT5E254_9BACT|nr:hypothetical protein [Nannocystis bainbridge]MDC0719865.1 hypothetical protein [Nannocystis bainbridge]